MVHTDDIITYIKMFKSAFIFGILLDLNMEFNVTRFH